MKAFKVIDPGPLTNIQDLGRIGYKQFGVPRSGALDNFACRAANLLTGAPEEAAVLEITFMGPKLEALADLVIALTGADMPLLINGRPAPGWTGLAVKAGDMIQIKPARRGLRGYLAAGPGFDVPTVMGSRSTYLGGGLGGFEGRALIRGDVLALADGTPARPGREIGPDLRPELSSQITLRAIPGPQDDYFGSDLNNFFRAEFQVSAKADRMGYRLAGPEIKIADGFPKSIISEPSQAGAVQVPADGQPIILLADHTSGGYAKPATVISSDLDLVAQARPGDRVKFQRVSPAQAQTVAREREDRLNRIREVFKK